MHCVDILTSSLAVRNDEENYACGDRDVTYHQVTSGVIEVDDTTAEYECKMRFSVQGSMRVKVTVDHLSMSSADCDEEYFGIFRNDNRGLSSDMKLCPSADPGDLLQTMLPRADNSQYFITFKLKLDSPDTSDRKRKIPSSISLHFNCECSLLYNKSGFYLLYLIFGTYHHNLGLLAHMLFMLGLSFVFKISSVL